MIPINYSILFKSLPYLIIVALLSYVFYLKHQVTLCTLAALKAESSLELQNQALIQKSKEDEANIARIKKVQEKIQRESQKQYEDALKIMETKVKTGCQNSIDFGIDMANQF